VDILEAITGYRQIRDAKKVAKKQFEEDWKPKTEFMGKLKGFFMDHLDKLGVDSFKTEAGTAYKTKTVRYVVTDVDLLIKHLEFVGDEWDLVKLNPVKDNVEAFKELNNGDLPPGVEARPFIDIGVRAPTNKS